MAMRPLSRRHFLRASTAWGAFTLTSDTFGLFDPSTALWANRLAGQAICPEAGPPGELIGVLPFLGDGPGVTPLGTILGEGLDARLFTDLARIEPDRLVTPTAEVFVRTAGPKNVARRTLEDWTIAVGSVERLTATISVRELLEAAKPMGPHLIECAGNSDPQNFGLLSVADWAGVPLDVCLDKIAGRDQTAAVLVSGWDHDGPSVRSVPGASWVFPLDAFERLGAFLATGMNGEPLPIDHGAPVRLVVPGWYGCSWIKWVSTIRFVRDEEPTTSQMQEFARRTHQDGTPARALQYAPPVIDLAATPIRVEKRRRDGRLEYRIVGIVWGGENAAARARLMIRFNPSDSFKHFTVCPTPTTHRTWSLWEYRWRPTAPGSYSIVLQAASPDIRARRLDLSFYIRRVVIDEV